MRVLLQWFCTAEEEGHFNANVADYVMDVLLAEVWARVRARYVV